MAGSTRARIGRGAAALVLLLGAAVGAGAAPQADQWSPSAGGWTSGPLEFVGAVPFEAGPAGGLDRRGDLLVATSWTAFSLYEISDPLAPELLSITPLGAHFINERPQIGDGWLAVNNDVVGELSIYDIADPTAPSLLATLSYPGYGHQWTCVLDCAYLYANNGLIVSMADPAAPAIVASWYDVLEEAPRATHGINEVAPGLVLTGTLPVHLLDARVDPERPALVASNDVPTTSAHAPYVFLGPPPESFGADATWPLDGSGDHALVSMETPFSGACNEESGEVLSLDMSAVFDAEDPQMPVVDRYQIADNGLPSDGLAPANLVGCSPYVMATHPGFESTGWVATAFMEHGVRLLHVGESGELTEAGGYVPHAGASAAPLWLDEEVLYVLDFNRGIDILRVDS
jgi:hypothetical protein